MTGTEHIAAEWQRRVAAEYRSAALTAQLAHLIIQVGLPHEFVDRAQRVVRDELDHAELSQEAMEYYGGTKPPVLRAERLRHPVHPQGPVATLLDLVLANFCIGETLAVPLFQAMWRGVSDDVAKRVVQRVLKDEVIHRQLGWDLLDELLARDPGGVRTFAASALDTHLSAVERAYAAQPGHTSISSAAKSAGLIPPSDYHRILWETVGGFLVDCCSERGIELSERWAAGGPQ